MFKIQRVSYDDLALRLSKLDSVDTIDMGSMQIHMANFEGESILLVENSANESESAIITLPGISA